MFPTDATTYRQTFSGAGSASLATSTRTILYVTTQKQNQNQILTLSCDGQTLASNFGSTLYTSAPRHTECAGELQFSQTGSGQSSFLVTYVDYDLTAQATTTPVNIPTYYDWLFATQVQIFILGVLAVGILFKFFRRR